MRKRTGFETGRDRRALVADAGYKQLSLFSALAGAIAAFGTLSVLAAAGAGIARADRPDLDLPAVWEQVDLTEGLAVAGALLVAFLFGGYVAGRMARRAGVAHGVAVFVIGIAAAAASYFVGEITAPLTAVVVSVAAMLVGAVAGGALGERWHAKLVTRALDPAVGAEAEARRDAEQRAAEAEQLRTGSFRRTRLATPSRTRRVDQPAVADDRDYRDDRDNDAPPPPPAPTDRQIARSDGRTG